MSQVQGWRHRGLRCLLEVDVEVSDISMMAESTKLGVTGGGRGNDQEIK